MTVGSEHQSLNMKDPKLYKIPELIHHGNM